MADGDKRRLLLLAALVAVAGLTACESAAEREARLEREAYLKSLDVEELKKQLETVNPDPYAPEKAGTKNIGRSRNN
jgi:hypothetical protein